jgi:hypothetical protein
VLYLAFVGFDPTLGYVAAEEINFMTKEFGFPFVTIQAIAFQGIKDEAHIFIMLLHSLRPDNNVIQVNMADLAYKFTKCRCNSALLYSGHVSQSLRHHEPLVQAERSAYRSVRDRVRVEACLEEAVGEINHRPDLSLGAISQYVVHSREGKNIMYRVGF